MTLQTETDDRRAGESATPSPSSRLIEVRDLEVHLPTGSRSEVKAVTSVSLSVGRGERVGIVGESGSGKSVSGRAIAGLLPTSPRVRVRGSIVIDGMEMVGAAPSDWDRVRRGTVGMIFQDPLTFLDPVMKIGRQVYESIPAHRDRRGRIPADARDEVLTYLRLAGLDEPERVFGAFPHELSGGMRQRALIAIAIAKSPDVLIADEPTTALDATVQQRVLDTLDSTVAELGTSLVLISHDIAVVSALTERIYVMYAGRVVESGSTEQVLDDPRHPYTRALLQSVRSLTEDDVPLYSIPDSLRASWEQEGFGDVA